MATGDTTQVGIERFEPFNPSIAYKEGDYVIADHKIIYQAMKDIPAGNKPDDINKINDDWSSILDIYTATWVYSSSYNQYDVVFYDYGYYMSLFSSNIGILPTNSVIGSTFSGSMTRYTSYGSLTYYSSGNFIIGTTDPYGDIGTISYDSVNNTFSGSIGVYGSGWSYILSGSGNTLVGTNYDNNLGESYSAGSITLLNGVFTGSIAWSGGLSNPTLTGSGASLIGGGDFSGSITLTISAVKQWWYKISKWDTTRAYNIGEMIKVDDVSINGSPSHDFKQVIQQNINSNPDVSTWWRTVYDPRPKITYMSETGHGSMGFLINNRLYTVSGHWGTNDVQESGHGLNGQNGQWGLNYIKEVQIPDISPIKKVGGWNNHQAWALCENGNLYTWGKNDFGSAGLGNTSVIGVPTFCAGNVSEVYTANQQQYSVDYSRMFVKKNDGSVWGAGYGGNGQFGNGSTANLTALTEIVALRGQVKKLYTIAGHWGYTVVLTNSGRIWVTGQNNCGHLGTGDYVNKTTFVDVTNAWTANSQSSVDDLKATGVAGYHDGGEHAECTLGMLITIGQQRRVVTCGNNTWGQIGNGTTTQIAVPYTVFAVNNLGITDIACFGGGPCVFQVLDTTGAMFSWGYNDKGNCANGAFNNTYTKYPGKRWGDTAKLLCDGWGSHTWSYALPSFILAKDGTLQAVGTGADWGGRGDGNDATDSAYYSQVRIPNNERVLNIGSYTTNGNGRIIFAYTDSGNLYGWGYNGNSGIASSMGPNCKVPVTVPIPSTNN